MIELNNIYQGDCLELMPNIPDKSIDAIICDLPYGVLNKGNASTKWDCVIPFEPLWEQYNRIIKDNGAIILFAQGMFTAQLMMSNPKMWRYNLIWDKMRVTAFLNANRMPMRCHEDICIFYKSLPTYNPQMEIGLASHSRGNGYHRKQIIVMASTRKWGTVMPIKQCTMASQGRNQQTRKMKNFHKALLGYKKNLKAQSCTPHKSPLT